MISKLLISISIIGLLTVILGQNLITYFGIPLDLVAGLFEQTANLMSFVAGLFDLIMLDGVMLSVMKLVFFYQWAVINWHVAKRIVNWLV